MPIVSPTLLKKCVSGVTKVLKDETKRAGDRNLFLSAYQILQLMSDGTRKRLLNSFGRGGKGCGNVPAATEVVMNVACKIHDIEIMYMDSRFTKFFVKVGSVMEPMKPAGNEYFAIYRLPTGKQKSRRSKLAVGVASNILKPKPKRVPPAGP